MKQMNAKARERDSSPGIAVLVGSAAFGLSTALDLVKVRAIAERQLPHSFSAEAFGLLMTALTPVVVAWVAWGNWNELRRVGRVGVTLFCVGQIAALLCVFCAIGMPLRYVVSLLSYASIIVASVTGVIEASRWLKVRHV